MATRLGHLAEQGPLQAPSPRLVILIGGVPPKDLEAESSTSSGSAEAKLLATPSPHIHDTADPLMPYSQQRLLAMFASSPSRSLLEQTEAHNIPSERTGLYPKISDWLKGAR